MPITGQYSTGGAKSWSGLDPDYKPHAKRIWEAARDQYRQGAPDHYTGDMVADLSPEQQAAMRGLRGPSEFAGQGSDYVRRSMDAARTGQQRLIDPNSAPVTVNPRLQELLDSN